ncbi:hypothetical protein DUI87_04563 [Hirundo rustica rustica]|uniref:Uncharacterized protein n=1 Tax=Hirundo rustica rustica TaxID=333673 RepID=A0A3M0LI01_HIRRU|nr:hypothetical protein DUI87_04563 [Hirundo rustica rustica]
MAAKGGKPLMRGRTAGGELDNILCHGKPDKAHARFSMAVTNNINEMSSCVHNHETLVSKDCVNPVCKPY